MNTKRLLKKPKGDIVFLFGRVGTGKTNILRRLIELQGLKTILTNLDTKYRYAEQMSLETFYEYISILYYSDDFVSRSKEMGIFGKTIALDEFHVLHRDYHNFLWFLSIFRDLEINLLISTQDDRWKSSSSNRLEFISPSPNKRLFFQGDINYFYIEDNKVVGRYSLDYVEGLI